MWKPEIPPKLLATIDERLIYEAFTDIHIYNLPNYEQVAGSFQYPKKCIAETRKVPHFILANEFWCALDGGYNLWLELPNVKTMIHSEDCANCLNAFAPRFELVGAEVFNIWAKKAQKMLFPLGIMLNQGTITTGLERAILQMEEHDFSQPYLSNCVFAANRRRFVEDINQSGGTKFTDKGDVFLYLLENCGKYEKDDNFLFRQARQIIQANGDLAPIEW